MPFPTHESLSSPLRFGPAGVPGGALTARGVDHMVAVGRALRRRYVDETGLLPPGFAPSAVYLRCVPGPVVVSRREEGACGGGGGVSCQSPNSHVCHITRQLWCLQHIAHQSHADVAAGGAGGAVPDGAGGLRRAGGAHRRRRQRQRVSCCCCARPHPRVLSAAGARVRLLQHAAVPRAGAHLPVRGRVCGAAPCGVIATAPDQ